MGFKDLLGLGDDDPPDVVWRLEAEGDDPMNFSDNTSVLTHEETGKQYRLDPEDGSVTRIDD